MTLASEAERRSARQVPLSEAHIEHIYRSVQRTQQQRYLDWLHRHEHMAADREYDLPKISEFYHRVLISSAARDALHVTRRAIESITRNTISGSQGQVAEWTAVIKILNINPLTGVDEEPGTPGHASQKICERSMTENSYDISEGVRFIRTPLAVRALERKYYVLDIEDF